MNWDELNQLTEPSWINLSELSDLLLSSDNLYLSGWAGEGDPLLAKAETLGEVNDEGSCFHPPMVVGGLCLNDLAFVFWCDPDDGYRSYLTDALVFPHQKFATMFSPVPVQAVAAEEVQEWGDPQNPSLLNLIATDIQKSVAQWGTDYDDSYYPIGIFYLDTQTLNEAIPLALRRTLKNQVGDLGTNSLRKI